MEKTIKQVLSEKGVTLVEVLAGLALLSMVLLLVNSVHLFSQKQTVSQTKEVQQQSDVRLASNLLTKEIRRAESVLVVSPVEFEIKKATSTTPDKYLYDGKDLLKNSLPLIKDIPSFTIEKNSEESISLTIGSLPKTTIMIRK
ncbi:prepilin-type N-terminal cleavage/methylation domain-containing protein [Neobacillus niacini]|uniref:PilW family protein n=1 Tax=Neobacillus niacini TaxID=86668 RepID=UPI002785FD15|nr:prepilin-type N-terminal cleavage/methylation domain-containing protein [Neobacillus niacini]MDQ1001324.1 prepilin-type N-terminal cleavage/methylation domain-containing protein [Neobacillus niacini]